MGDTFDRIQELQREAKTKEICSLLSEYWFFIKKEEIAANRCIIVASYDSKEENDNTGTSWEGKLAALKKFFISLNKKMLEENKKSIDFILKA